LLLQTQPEAKCCNVKLIHKEQPKEKM
jgi:hypothetical protein